MKPSQVIQALRHIASKIQNSKQPDCKLVAQDLKQILAAMGGKFYLVFSAGSGTQVWELEGAENVDLRSLIEQYNSEEAWKARGGDGSVELVSDINDELRAGAEGVGPLTTDRACQMLSGEIDPFLNDAVTPS